LSLAHKGGEMRDPYVFILTQRSDVTVDRVIGELNQRQVPIVRFDTSDFPLRAMLSARLDTRTWRGMIAFESRSVDFERITAAWYRRPKQFEFAPELTAADREYAAAEARHAVGGLLRSLDCLWVNHPEKEITAGFKPLQLKAAVECRLTIPLTLISNDPAEVRRFFAECGGDMIYKSLSSKMVMTDDGRQGNIFTSRVSVDDLKDEAAIRQTACMFQKHVAKDIELRLTIIGEQIYAAAIYSQELAITETDWRRGQGVVRYEKYVLPSDIASKCLALLKLLGLVFGTVDFIVTPDGEYLFLEVNPSGQWAWIEDATGLPLTRAMADLLVSQSSS